MASSKQFISMPIKMWIDGKIYHIQKMNKKLKKKQKETVPEIRDVEQEIKDVEEPLKQLDIKEENGKFSTNLRLPKLYYTKIHNLPDFSIDKLSEATKTKIIVPKLGQEGELCIRCDDTGGLLEAVRHIHSAVSEIRDRNIPLQFVCIPCSSENIRKRFEELKSEILSKQGEIDGLHESIFMCPLKLHITIDVYTLLDDQEKEEAVNALSDYKTHLDQVLAETGPLKLNISGLDYMNDNIRKVDVLYANIKLTNETAEHSLQKIANNISNHFYNRGLARKFQDNVKLHMTVINTKYRRNTESPKRKRRRQSIDATIILDKFRDFAFGECDFDSLHLSHMSARGDDGFYKPLAVINLHDNKEIK